MSERRRLTRATLNGSLADLSKFAEDDATAGQGGPPGGGDRAKHFTGGKEMLEQCVNSVAVVATAEILTPRQRDRRRHLCDCIRDAYKQHQQADRKGVTYLSEIWRDKLYRDYGSLNRFIACEFNGKTRQWAYNKIMQAKVLANLKPIGIEEISEEKAKLLKNFAPDEQRKIAQEAAGSRRNGNWERIAANYANKRESKGHQEEPKEPHTNVLANNERRHGRTAFVFPRRLVPASGHNPLHRHRPRDRQHPAYRSLAASVERLLAGGHRPRANVAKVIQHREDGTQDVVETEFKYRPALLGILGNWAEYFHVVKLGYQEQ